MICITLATTTVSLGVWAVSLTTQVATFTASAAATAIQNRKAIVAAVARTKARMTIQRKKAVTRAVVRTKAKGRLRRVLVAVPLAGIAAAVAFERNDYLHWKEDNPNGNLTSYGCVISSLSADVIDEVLQELPESARPSRDLLRTQMLECGDLKTAQSTSR